ncbi:MAG: DUF1565 domain-containing protein, partial [Pirellulaceae bacterium]|nr:DUF1565 domain-containing protein [Pirellulaceae bacterium]
MKTAILTLFATLLPAPLAALYAAEFHVAPNGNDANPGTQAKPFATIQAGVNKLRPGGTLLIHGGVYRETVTFPRSGTDAKPITVTALEPTKLAGPQTLCFVVRSATGKSLGAIDWISLEKAKEPMEMAGLGPEPLQRGGQFVFPEPTHRPLPPGVRRLSSRLQKKLEAQ